MASAHRRPRPAEIVEKLNKEINAVLADPKIKARLADLGGSVLPGSPSDFGKLIAKLCVPDRCAARPIAVSIEVIATVDVSKGPLRSTSCELHCALLAGCSSG